MGVILGGLVILLTGWQLADPLISLAVAVLIAKGAWDVLRETVDILMEAAPKNLNVAQLVRDVLRVPVVNDVHDLHVWSLAGGMPCLSAHVQVDTDRPLSACDGLLADINHILRNGYKIAHTMIQFEWAGCAPNDLYCNLSPEEPAGDAHASAAHAHAHGAGGHDHDHPDDELDVQDRGRSD